MKGHSYRQIAQNRISQQQDDSLDQLTRLIDNKLFYLNRSFENNLKIHELYLDLIKSKKCLHAKDLKQYYRIFTNSKAEAVMFNNQMEKQKQEGENHQYNHQMLITIKRMYCRLIQKMMIKISYYLMNKHSLSFCNHIVNQLIKKCDVLVRRLNHLKDMSCMNEIIEKVFEENEQFQNFIFSQLIHKGYITSVDEFYRINGIDLEHQDIFQRNKNVDEEVQQKEQNQQQHLMNPRVKRNALYISNLGKDLAQSDMKKEIKNISKIQVNRVGTMQIEFKYRQLLLNLDQIMSSESQFEQIIQAKENQEKDQAELYGSALSEETNHSLQLQVTDKYGQIDEIEEEKKPKSVKKTLKSLTQQSYINEKSINLFESRGELHQKQLTINNFSSNKNVSELMLRAQNKRKSSTLSSRYFSKSFINAIKTLEKTSLNDLSNRLSIKRMSEHIIQFHKQSERQDNLDSGYKDKISTISMLKKNKEKMSIIKLLNIYKNRTIEQFIDTTRKDFQQAESKITERVAQINRSKFKNQKIVLLSQNYQDNSTAINFDNTLKRIKRGANRGLTKISNFKQESQNKFMHLSYLKGHLQNNYALNKSQQLLKQFNKTDMNRQKQIASSLNFQNFRTNQRFSESRQKEINFLSSLKPSPQKKSLQNSIMTSKGIENIEFSKLNSQKSSKKSKTAETTAIQSPYLPYFEVYDRSRRMIIK